MGGSRVIQKLCTQFSHKAYISNCELFMSIQKISASAKVLSRSRILFYFVIVVSRFASKPLLKHLSAPKLERGRKNVFLFFRRSNEANRIWRWTVQPNLMWMCFYSAHLFFTYSLVEKRGSWDKNAKAMNDEPTEKRNSLYILCCYLSLSLSISNCLKRKRLSLLPILLFRFLDTIHSTAY